MAKVRLGIIGVGNIGTTHCKNIIEGRVPEIEITAAADRREQRRQWVTENVGDVAVFNEATQLIDSGTCDAVLIAVPHYQHPELAILALDRGLHVMCEKPAGVYTKQAREMIEAAAGYDLTFGMMFNQRTNSVYRKMHDVVHSGEYGAIMRVNWIITDWFRTQSYYDSGDWRGTWNGEGGGVLLNQCPHQLDLLTWICGLPKTVQAFCIEGQWHDIEVEDDVTAYMQYDNGATGVFITSTGDTPGTNRFEVSMEKAKIICENNTLTLFELSENGRDYCKRATDGFSTPDCTISTLEVSGEYPEHSGVLNAFAANILRGEPLIAHGREGINGLELSNAMHLSSWLRRAVQLPVDEDLFLSELNKKRSASARGINL